MFGYKIFPKLTVQVLVLALMLNITVFTTQPTAQTARKAKPVTSSDGGSETDYATGLIWDSWDIIEANLREDPPLDAALPSSVDLEDVFPAPGNQGRQNSCVPWAVAYALRSHQEEVKQKWGLSADEHLFSPGYIYNQIDNGYNKGTTTYRVMDMLVEQGVSTLAAFPYNEYDSSTQPTENQKEEAANFKIAEWYTIRGRDSIKRRLANGDGVVVGLEIYPDFNNLNTSNPIYDVVSGTSKGGHTVCFIGYDDEKDAFKFINSWGTGWGLGGYGWISYDLLDDARVGIWGLSIGFVMDAHTVPTFIEDSFEYTISNLGEATITRYMGAGGDVIIPETLGGYPVIAIANRVFRDNTSLTGITIPDSMITIGDSAFSRCTALKRIVIGNGVTHIGDWAFFDCSSLTNVVMPDSVARIGECAFSNCKTLTDAVIGKGVTAIGRDAFEDCINMTLITFVSATPPTFGADVFRASLNLKTIYVPKGSKSVYKAEPQLSGYNIIETPLTVTFNSLEGTAVAPLTNITPFSKITAPTPPTRIEYIFGGWYTDSAYTSEWDFETDIVTDDITLYANWTQGLNIEIKRIGERDCIEIRNNNTDQVFTTKGMYIAINDEFAWHTPAFIVRPGHHILIRGNNDNITKVLKRAEVNFDLSLIEKLSLVDNDLSILSQWQM